MAVLSAADRDFWDENGYVILHEAVPEDNLRAVVDALWDFLEVNRNDLERWYKAPIVRTGNLVQHVTAWQQPQAQHQAAPGPVHHDVPPTQRRGTRRSHFRMVTVEATARPSPSRRHARLGSTTLWTSPVDRVGPPAPRRRPVLVVAPPQASQRVFCRHKEKPT